MKPHILDGREVKDAVTKLTMGERNKFVSHVQAGCGNILDTVERVWDAMERYLTNKSNDHAAERSCGSGEQLKSHRHERGFGG